MSSSQSRLLNIAAGILLAGVTILALVLITRWVRQEPAPAQLVLQGQVEATSVDVSSKIPARVLTLAVKEGQRVKRGDVLLTLDSPEARAKLAQAEAGRDAAQSMEDKARHGARVEEIRQAEAAWQRAQVGVGLAEKTFGRLDRLSRDGVVPAQRRDEAQAALDSARDLEHQARAAYDLARAGARDEDKRGAAAQTARARGVIAEVEAAIAETTLVAPIDGEVTTVNVRVGELVGPGAPIITILDTTDMWVSFHVREDQLAALKVGDTFDPIVPALGKTTSGEVRRLLHLPGGELRHVAFDQRPGRVRPEDLRGTRQALDASPCTPPRHERRVLAPVAVSSRGNRVSTDARRGGVLAVAAREVRRVLDSPLLVALLVVLPVVLTVWVLAIFKAPTPRDLPVAWVDEDQSSVSRAVLRMIDATPGIALTGQAPSLAEAEHLVRRGAVYAIVVIPHGFQEDVVRGNVPVATCFYNAQALLAGGVIGRDFQAAVLTASAGAEVLAAQARGVSRASIGARVEPVVTRSHLLYNPQLNYDYYLVAALLPTLLQMLMTMAMAVAVGEEFKHGTAGEWVASGRGSLVRAAAGKTLVYLAWFGMLATAMLAVIFGVIGTPARGDLAVLVGGAWLFALASISVGFAIVILSGSLRLAASVVALYTGVAFPFIGVTFPSMAMPPAARAWAAGIPLTHFVNLLLEQGIRGATPFTSAPHLVALAWFVVGSFLVLAWPLQRLASGTRTWRAE